MSKFYKRCPWVGRSQLEIDYHDKEWGVPCYDDQKLFEFIVLESAEAGLSWKLILNKREGYRKAFSNFDFNKVANYSEQDIKELLENTGIVRHRQKIESAVNNAKCFQNIITNHGSFSRYIWSFTGTPVHNTREFKDIPTKTILSDTITKSLKQRGFRFFGTQICYSFLQAIGIVNDHTVECFRYKELTS